MESEELRREQLEQARRYIAFETQEIPLTGALSSDEVELVRKGIELRKKIEDLFMDALLPPEPKPPWQTPEFWEKR